MKCHICLLLILVQLLTQVTLKAVENDGQEDTTNQKNTDKPQEQTPAPVKKEHHHPAKHWGYRNQDKSILPKEWHKSHPKCYGNQQSPINIETSSTLLDNNLATLTVSSVAKIVASASASGDLAKESWNITNNGHSVVLNPTSHEFSFLVQPENVKYELLQMHFHWRGSEHYINGHRYAAELHLVHRSTIDPTKFAVLGFLFYQSNDDNDKLAPIVDSLDDVINYNSRNKVDTLKLAELIPFSVNNYYRYSGSLTTPSCDEVVEWFVIQDPILKISDEQLLEFQSLEDNQGYPILTNSRPIQEINQRLVRRSFESGKSRVANIQSGSENNSAQVIGGSSLVLLSSIVIARWSIF